MARHLEIICDHTVMMTTMRSIPLEKVYDAMEIAEANYSSPVLEQREKHLFTFVLPQVWMMWNVDVVEEEDEDAMSYNLEISNADYCSAS